MEPSPCHIVLAEDNPADVRLDRVPLVNMQCIVIFASYRMARTFCRSSGSSIAIMSFPVLTYLLLDLHLPNGMATKRSGTWRRSQIPDVGMTSSASPSDHKAAEEHAALYYSRKPMSLVQFMHRGRKASRLLCDCRLLHRTDGDTKNYFSIREMASCISTLFLGYHKVAG